MVEVFCNLAIISFSLVFLTLIWYAIENAIDSPRTDLIEFLILGLLGITCIFLALTVFFYFL